MSETWNVAVTPPAYHIYNGSHPNHDLNQVSMAIVWF
jgi:hypothetical protein